MRFPNFSWSFGADLAVKGNTFRLSLPLNHAMTIQSIHYTKIGNWIELSGVMEAPKSSVVTIDGTATTQACRATCRACKGKKETRQEAQGETRTEFI
jgi:hypothetical protein